MSSQPLAATGTAMDYEDSIAAARAKQDELVVLNTARDELLVILTNDGEVPRLRSKFVVEGQSVSATCFDYKAIAEPRLVCIKEGELAIEYAFFVSTLPNKCVWSFVVLSDKNVSFVPSTGFLEGSVRIGVDAPSLSEILMLQLHGAVLGHALVSQSG